MFRCSDYKGGEMKEKIWIGIAMVCICIFSIWFATAICDYEPKPVKIEKQKVIRGEIIYKGEVMEVILRESMERRN